VWVTSAKAAIGAVLAIAIWPYIPVWEATLGHVDGVNRQWARAAWMLFAVFVVAAAWSGVKAVQGAWMAAR
jgi:EamA domain-containing membrane protein RarD